MQAHALVRITGRPASLIATIAVITLYLCPAAAAQHSLTDSVTILFQQSRSELRPGLFDNGDELARMAALMRRASGDSALSLRAVRVAGGASPEGSVQVNERLSRRRAQSLFDYLSREGSLPDSLTSYTFLGRDWRGLRALVAADPAVPNQREALTVIDEALADGDTPAASDRALRRLRRLGGGAAYRYMYARLFPRLRASTLTVQYAASSMPAAVPEELTADSVDILPPPAVIDEEVQEMTWGFARECRPFYMGLKTNMLYDALALPTIGAEVYVGKGWSVGANWTYGWWDNDHRHRYWRAYGGDVNVRRWFGHRAQEKPLTGHHAGLYAGVVTYDFEFGGKGYMGGLPGRTLWDRCNYFAGLEYGYSLPVGRRLNIDFTIGIGYMGGKYLEYEPSGDSYVWEKTMRMHWFGPTKAEVSLVWLIGCDNYNKKGDHK